MKLRGPAEGNQPFLFSTTLQLIARFLISQVFQYQQKILGNRINRCV